MLATRTLLSIIREVDLFKIQEEAEVPVRLVLLGDEEDVRELARVLGKTPWVSALTSLEGRRSSDVLLRISREQPLQPLPQAGLDVLLEAKALKISSGQLVLADLSDETIERFLTPALLAKVPDSHKLSLARHVPIFRAAYARWLIEQTSRSNATYAASTGLAAMIPALNVPLNVADMVILTKNQLVMAYKLALAEGKRGQPVELMKELISVVGGSLLFIELARKLIGFVPAIGIVPKVAVAYGGTQVIGKVVYHWATKEELVLENLPFNPLKKR